MAPTAVYDIQQTPESERARQVTTVRAVIYSMGPLVTGGQLSQNHWTVELVHLEGCIRLDMSLYDPRSTTDFRGLLKVLCLPYQLSSRYVNYLDFEPSSALTVGHFTNNLVEKGRQRYNMTNSGVGCRHWIRTVIADWQQAGFIGPKTSGGYDIDNYVNYNWSKGQVPVFLEVKAGTFY